MTIILGSTYYETKKNHVKIHERFDTFFLLKSCMRSIVRNVQHFQCNKNVEVLVWYAEQQRQNILKII